MMPSDRLRPILSRAFKSLFAAEIEESAFTLSPTRKEFQGEFTLLVFPWTQLSKKGPEQTAEVLGQWLVDHAPEEIQAFEVVKGFLNLTLQPQIWHSFLNHQVDGPLIEFPSTGEKVLVEFASPNTNKPLHLGHIRNILLGWSMARILERVGNTVYKVQVVNDRGIAICKSMLAWMKYGEGVTPQKAGIKGDHLVGDYYIRFETASKEEYTTWQESPEAERIWEEAMDKKGLQASGRAAFFKEFKNNWFNTYSKLGKEAQELLVEWEKGDARVRDIWATMNGWVYEGFEETYQRLGVSFDKVYYESNTYLLGKDLIEKGEKEEVFYRKADGSVWVDLTDAGLDQKLVLRGDGTSVYITQDLGTAQERYEDFGANKMIYVVADEQNYHFQVLFQVMKRLKAPYAEGMVHLSYGMVELPSGRMKSREGTVVDADDLINEVIMEARTSALERGEMEGIPHEEREEIFRKVGLAALKFHIIKVNARKKMIFDPSESVDMQGHTGPYIQNAYVRIQSILEKAGQPDNSVVSTSYKLQPVEMELALLLCGYGEAIQLAASQYDPSFVANYAYPLAKAFHKFYHDSPILRAESAEAKHTRLRLSVATARILADAMQLLGIEMPRRM